MTSLPVVGPGAIDRFLKSDVGLSAQTANAFLSIRLFSASVVNIRFTRTEQFDPHSYAVVREPGSVEFSLGESEKEIRLTGEKFSLLLSRSDAHIRMETLSGEIINEDEKGLGTSWNGQQVSAYKHLQDGERFIGLGEKVGPLDRRGRGYVHYNIDAFAYGSGTDPIYSSIPFYIGIQNGLVYGIFFDNSSRTSFNFGASNNRFASFTADEGEMNYYFIYGESVAEIIRSYTWLTGTIQLPPLWSLGYQQCRYSYYPDREVLDLARNFRDRGIPADTLVLDIHYMDAYKIFTWHPEYFPDPAGMISKLEQQGFHIVVMCDPGIKTEPGYAPYDEGKPAKLFIQYPDGEDYTGQVWPGWCHFPDFTNPRTREAWTKWMKSYTDIGIEGFWNDMNEFSTWGQMMPENLIFDFEGRKGTTRSGRNVYGLQMARSTYEAAKAHLKGRRPFNLTRSGYAGIQRYAALWTGDNVSYDEHMLLGVRLVNSLGLCGVSFAGYDIGGFVGDASPRLFARWISIGALSPFCRTHTMINSRDSEPWSYGEEVEIISRNYIRLRYQLLPYIYSVFREASVTGMPVQRSLAIIHPHRKEVFEGQFENQYLFGPDILVAPVESSQDLAKVFLPEGTWYHLNDGTSFDGNKVHVVDCPVHRLPVFIRGGAVIPMQDPIQHTGETSSVLHFHVYKGEAGTEFNWYTDDGATFDFEKGAYCLRNIRFDGQSNLTIGAADGNYRPHFKTIRIILHGFNEGVMMKLNQAQVELKGERHSFFQPMEKFDPLGDAPEVGSEEVQIAQIPFAHAGLHLSLTNP